MSNSVIQHAFNGGEWAPALNARVDLAKYHSGAALLRNFFVDYRGGATTRPGTRYINQTLPNNPRLIPFQASRDVTYILEFTGGFIRFYNNGAPVLEAPVAITGITNANPGVVTITNTYANGDWVYITGVGGMTGLNGNYFIVAGRTATTITLQYLDGTAVNTTTFGAYTGGGQAQRVYTIASSYATGEIYQVKYAQSGNVMILTHPNHLVVSLTMISATNWVYGAVAFGATIAAPSITSVTTSLGAGTVNYQYIVTAVDANGQESPPSAPGSLTATDIRTNAGTITVLYGAVAGAVSYNIYRTVPSYSAIPGGADFGFCGNQTGLSFIDSNIIPDFAFSYPIVQNPFSGSGVQSLTLTGGGSYTSGTIPTVTLTGGGGTGATATCAASVISATVSSAGLRYLVGDTITVQGGAVLRVASLASGAGDIATVTIANAGVLNAGITIQAPAPQVSTSSANGAGASFNLTWTINSLSLVSPGTGYATPPSVVFSSGAASGTSALGAGSAGNPSVCGFFQQRLVLAGPSGSPQQINMSQTGSYYNFNINSPLEASDAIQGTLVSGQVNVIQSMVSQPYGLIVLSDKGAWLINGGSNGSAVTPMNITANPQIYNGAASLPPILANDNILYVQSKNSIVRNLVFNYYTQIYTGADISILSSHLFYGHNLVDWAYAEEPFKMIWAVRNDGVMLTLTFLREQELIAWSHADTNGIFKSVAVVTEATSIGYVDAVYAIVQRTVNGVTVNYVERFVELNYPLNYTSSWQVDAGLNYTGAATTTFSGARHLAGLTVTGVADGAVIPPFTMPATGSFTLGVAASNVTIGLGFTAQLQTLALDVGEPTVQGKRKKISAVTVRCKDALGLQIGGDSTTLVAMKDLVLGNVGSATNTVVSGLVTGDARTILDPRWTVPGQYFIQQANPYPASILGVIPEIELGDTPK